MSIGDASACQNGFLVLADGTEVSYVSYIENACSNRAFPMDGDMPVREGKVDDRVVQTLRDTGCSGILVKQELVKPDQYTGKFGLIKLVDCTVREVPLAKIKIDTPYLTADVEALCPATQSTISLSGTSSKPKILTI